MYWDFVDLVGGDDDGAVVIEVVVEQGVVELLAERMSRPRVGSSRTRSLASMDMTSAEVELRDHALGELAHFGGALDGGAGEEGLGLGAVETGMDAGDKINRVGYAHPAREDGDVGDEGYVGHELVTLGPGIMAEDGERAAVGGEAEDGVEQGWSCRRRWGR